MPSSRPGMGAVPFDGGVMFRVWAPFASWVSAVGDFNGWSNDKHPLDSENNGYWSADVADARVSQQYKFLIVNRDSGNGVLKNDPYALAQTASGGNSIVTQPPVAPVVETFILPPHNELVIYELHVGTFSSDPNAYDRRGTFDSLIGKLDYLRDLGVNAIELMPSTVFPSNISGGYNPSALFAIDRDYGGLEGFLKLVSEAHQRSIAVLSDVVYNHLGNQDLDLWQFDGWSQDGGGGIYFYNDWRSRTPWGDTRPNYGRPEVRRFLLDNAMFWYEGIGVDGLRWDATSWIRNVAGRDNDPGNDIPEGWQLMQDINGALRASQPRKLSIAEDMQGNAAITRDTADGGAGFSAQWDIRFLRTIRNALTAADDGGRDVSGIKAALEGGTEDTYSRVIYTESHDQMRASAEGGQHRLPTAIDAGDPTGSFARRRANLGAVLVLTARGIPMVFQGQEFLTTDAFMPERPLDWSALERNQGVTQLYRDLIHLRRNWFDHTRGLTGDGARVHHVNDVDKILAVHRWNTGGPKDDVIVLLNFSGATFDRYQVGFPREGVWRVRFDSEGPPYGGDRQPLTDIHAVGGARDGMAYEAEVTLSPWSALILSQDE